MPDRDALVGIAERWITSFNDGLPSADLVTSLLTPDARFVEHPNAINPAGSDRDLDAMLHGLELGASLLATQRYEPTAYVVEGDTVVARFRWTGTLAKAAGPFVAGTQLEAQCCAHYTIDDDRIARIEQHDCYARPVPPAA